MSKYLPLIVQSNEMWSTNQWLFNKISSAGLTLVRIWLGVVMMRHSYPVFVENGFADFGNWLDTLQIPVPHFMAYLSKGGELFGGFILVIGLFTRFAAFVIGVNMLVAVFIAHSGTIFSDASLAFGYLIMAIAIFLHGPDKWCVDRWINKYWLNTKSQPL